MYTTSLAQLPTLETNTIFQQGKKIASAVEYIHNNGWVHLDIKASNVFISADGKDERGKGEWERGYLNSLYIHSLHIRTMETW
jgi:serine/threonine protein kinase